MVFHSYPFILGMLPVCYAGFILAFRFGGWQAAFRFLAAASLAFYALWSVALAAILIASVTLNYLWSRLIRASMAEPKRACALLVAGITGNLAALAYLKYANFLIDLANLGGGSHAHISLVVPVGVSFYTFIQIGYLIETYAGQVQDPGFGRYLLFATFFPCVTAGPLVQPREILDQMGERTDSAFNPATLAAGVAMFVIGLFKKVVLADQIAPTVDQVFAAAGDGGIVTATAAWMGATLYALQLYFDFSGYSDMAIGLGCVFGLKLPLNFNSPFKSTNISDFWRAWHMTMTRFFTTYIYTPMAVRAMRSGLERKQGALAAYISTGAIPAITTFLVAGIWHGAGWTFAIYGLIHGVAVATYVGWSRLQPRSLPMPLAWLATMAVVVSALVVFRAPDLATAGALLGPMWSFGLAKPVTAAAPLIFDYRSAGAMLIVLGAMVLLMPNSQQIVHRYWISSDPKPADAAREAGLLAWRPTPGVAIIAGLVLCIAVGSIGANSTFLYYQF